MLFLSHRGLWRDESEQNLPIAFERSFANRFGAETDVRDALGTLVISHDPPRGNEASFTQFLQQYRESGQRVPIALNMKAAGLAEALARLLTPADNCFVFDLSTPDMCDYLRRGMAVFSRQSEIEQDIVLYDRVQGVWMDCFYGDWFVESDIAAHLSRGKKVCLVSPELHGRDPRPLWNRLATMSLKQHSDLMLCTDHPEVVSSLLFQGS